MATIQETINQLMQREVDRQTNELARLNSFDAPGNARYLTGQAIEAAKSRGKELLDFANQGVDLSKLDPAALTGYIQNSPTGLQAINEYVANQKQLTSQNQQLQDYRNQLETQQFGGVGKSLSDALSSTQGDIGNLNQFLGQQESQTFNTQLKPLIQMALGSKGLSDSGAQVELQSKALAQLEQQRQETMMQAALGARSQIQGIQYSDLLGSIGGQQNALNSTFDLQRTGMTMEFQRQLELQRDQLARDLSSYGGSGPFIGSMVGMGVGGAIGGYYGGPQGAAMGAGRGGQVGGGIENVANGGNIGNAASSFFPLASYLPNSWRGGSSSGYQRSPSSSPYGEWRGPTNNGPSSGGY